MPERRVRIAQISDLHINRKVEGPVTDMLKQVLNKIKADIVVVSGDLANQPVPWQMRKAAKLLREIEQTCKPARMVVIPGNHDFKFWGNMGLRRLSRIPFEIYFRRNGLDLGAWSRWGQMMRLALNALWWRGSAMREPVTLDLLPERPEWGVALFTVNSNTLAEMMAAGKVESRDLQALYAQFDKAQTSAAFAFYYKIAVVHHHPAPIADAPTDAIARIQDSFMLFYNAGLFVRELSRRGFHLVLHGHRHVAGFVRISCEFSDQGRTVLPIAAAGTATHPSPDDSRGHHIHVIDIFDDDTARLDSWFFSADMERKDESRSYELDTLPDVRTRRYAIFRRLQKYFSAEVRKTVEITRDGYSRVEITHRGSRVHDAEGLEKIPLSLTTERPVYVRGVEPAGSSAFLQVRILEQKPNLFRGEVDLGRKWKPGDGPFDFGYRYRVMNGHVFTAEEFRRHYSGTAQEAEFASVTCHCACDLMTLSVRFPDDYDVEALEFRAMAEYVAAPLQGIDDDRLDRGVTKRHDEETGRIAGNIRRELHARVLTCPQPVPGMIYKLCWKFPEPGGAVPDLAMAAEVASVKKRLLTIARTASADAAARAAWDRARSILDSLGRDVARKLSAAAEEFKITVMVFDEGSQRLRFVCANTEPEAMPTGDFYAGEGCAGFAFEKARYILYHPQRDPLGYFIHRSEWPTGDLVEEPAVLASFPWIHNPDDEDRRLVIGVVNVSSQSPTTRLLGLFAPESAGTMKTLQALVNLAGSRLFVVD